MNKARSIVLALGAAAIALAPMAPAHATTVGGQTVSAGPCDVTLASITFYTDGRIEQVTVGHVDC
jgi:hypothetical protein